MFERFFSRKAGQSPDSIRFFLIGAIVFALGLCLRIGMILYARVLLQQMEAASAKATGPDFLVSDALMNIKIGTIVSYFLMLGGTSILLLGVIRNRKAAISPLN